jgi:hypothetical protein
LILRDAENERLSTFNTIEHWSAVDVSVPRARA